MKINVIGGCNIDISATPFKKVKLYDSNPGKIEITLGGVGRNIAHNLALLNQDVTMFTALSNDNNGKMIIDSCEKLNINLDYAIKTNDFNQSIYLCVNDEKGDMLVGSSDMDIISLISINYIKDNIKKINDCDYLVIDTNLDEETLEYIMDNVNVRICVESVSANKCVKIANIIKRKNNANIYMLKANKIEAETLGERTINDNNDLNVIASYLHSKGIQNVCITLGNKGAFFSNNKESFIVPSKSVDIVNATGAGDAFFAGIIYGHSKTNEPKEMINYAISASKIALESINAVSEEMSEEKIKKYL